MVTAQGRVSRISQYHLARLLNQNYQYAWTVRDNVASMREPLDGVLGGIGLQRTQQTKMTSVLKITVVLVICFISVEYRKDKVFSVICEKGLKANRSQIPS